MAGSTFRWPISLSGPMYPTRRSKCRRQGSSRGNQCHDATARPGSARRRRPPGAPGHGGRSRVLGKMRSTLLVAAVLIILTAAVCVLATLTGWVSDRRRDFALMKALGASGATASRILRRRGAALGAAGSVLGFGIGLGVAVWIGRANFHAPVSPRLSVFPVILVGGIWSRWWRRSCPSLCCGGCNLLTS